MATVRTVSTITTSVVFLDAEKKRCIIDDVVYKRETRGRSRSDYMKAYRKRRLKKVQSQSHPYDQQDTVEKSPPGTVSARYDADHTTTT